MENKMKFVVIALAGLLFVLLFAALQLNTAKQTVERERDELTKEVNSLTQQNDGFSREIRRLQDERNTLQKQLERISQAAEEIQLKYQMIAQEREVLIERLKTKPAVATAVEPSKATKAPQTDDAYWAGILQEKTDLAMQLQNTISELKAMRIANEELQRDKAALELDLKNLNRENYDLNRQLEYNRKIMDSLSQEIVREKNDKFKIEEALKSIKSENHVLRQQLKSLDNRKINLEKKIGDLQKENTAISKKVDEMGIFLQEKGVQIDKLKKQLEAGQSLTKVAPESSKESPIELPPIVVRPGEAGAEVPGEPAAVSFRGKILAINRDNNFAIVDLGQDQGIKPGDTFQVYRQHNIIAILEVIQTRKEISACDIKKEDASIKVGDAIR